MDLRCIRQIGIGDITSRLPDEEELGIVSLDSDQTTALICAGGFENRAVAICEDHHRFCVDEVLVIEYPTNELDNRGNLEKILREFSTVGSCTKVRYGRDTFLRDMRRLIVQWELKENSNVIVDLSGMASFILFRILSALWDLVPMASLYVYYAEAEEYFPSETEWRDTLSRIAGAGDLIQLSEEYRSSGFQSHGVDSVYESDVFPGKNIDALPLCGIVVPNFSHERAYGMLSYITSAPWDRSNEILWLLGNPPDRERNGWRFEALRTIHQCGERALAVSTFKYKDIIHVLEQQWERSNCDRHLVIASLGSKMQHLGAFFFLCMHPEVGLVLSEPSAFEAGRFSRGIGKRWAIDFGRIGRIQEDFEKLGALEFAW